MNPRLTLAVILPHGDHLIDDFHGSKALALTLPDLFRVTAALGNWFTQSQYLTRTRIMQSDDSVQLVLGGAVYGHEGREHGGIRTEIVDVKHFGCCKDYKGAQVWKRE